MGTQATGEQAVAVHVVHLVAGLHTGHTEAAGHQGAPGFQVVLGVGHHGGLTGGSGRRVDAADLGHGRGERLERVGLPQEFLVRVRELGQVLEFLEVIRVHAVLVEELLVRRNVLVGVVQGPVETLGLQRLDLVPAHGLFGIRLRGIRRLGGLVRIGNGAGGHDLQAF